MEVKWVNVLTTNTLEISPRIWMSPSNARRFDTDVSVRVGATALVRPTDAQASHTAIQVAAVGLEASGGLGHIAVCVAERSFDHVSLDLFEGIGKAAG